MYGIYINAFKNRFSSVGNLRLTSEAMSTYVQKEYGPPSWAKQLSYVPTHRYQASSEELNGHHYNSLSLFLFVVYHGTDTDPQMATTKSSLKGTT